MTAAIRRLGYLWALLGLLLGRPLHAAELPQGLMVPAGSSMSLSVVSGGTSTVNWLVTYVSIAPDGTQTLLTTTNTYTIGPAEIVPDDGNNRVVGYLSILNTVVGGGSSVAISLTTALTPTFEINLSQGDQLLYLGGAFSVVEGDGTIKVTSSGGGGGGTSSNFNAAFPAAGTAAGFNDGIAMQGARVFDGDSGGGTEYDLGVNLRQVASGGTVEAGIAAHPLRIDPTGTTTQPVSGTLAVTGPIGVTQSTSPWVTSGTSTVSGTVSATQGTSPWVVSNGGIFAVQGAVTQVTSPWVVSNGGTFAVQATQAGTWNLNNVSGTVSLPTGAATETTLAKIPSTINAARPATATLIGGDDGIAMQAPRVYDVNSGASAEYDLGVRLTSSGTLGGVELGTSANPLRTDPTGATGQPVTNAGTFAVQATAPTLTKGTQGANGWSVQDLHDAGRTALSLYANNVASGTTTTETLITLTQSKGTGATTSAASYTITSGKTLRIEAIQVASRGNATATIQSTVFNLRLNTAGACVVTSTPILAGIQSATAAVASAWDRVTIPILDGYEIAGNGTIAICLSAAATFTTNAPTWAVNLIGYEY